MKRTKRHSKLTLTRETVKNLRGGLFLAIGGTGGCASNGCTGGCILSQAACGTSAICYTRGCPTNTCDCNPELE